MKNSLSSLLKISHVLNYYMYLGNEVLSSLVNFIYFYEFNKKSLTLTTSIAWKIYNPGSFSLILFVGIVFVNGVLIMIFE